MARAGAGSMQALEQPRWGSGWQSRATTWAQLPPSGEQEMLCFLKLCPHTLMRQIKACLPAHEGSFLTLSSSGGSYGLCPQEGAPAH